MSLHVVLGAGPVGTTTARLLAERGERVRLITRSGSGPEHPGVEGLKVDATDADALIPLVTGADVLYHCAAPPYHRWTTDFPPLSAAAIAAAEATGAVLVSAGNLYGYGPVDGPMTEDLPARPNTAKGRVRAELWSAQLTAHQAGRIRTAEVRGSDYLGANAASEFTLMVLPAVLRGRRALVPADPDAPHSWTYTGDMARTLIAVAAAESAWGRPWHAPTPPPKSIRELAELTGPPTPRIGRMPLPLLRLAGLISRPARELPETRYQFDRPFIMDSTAAQAAFDIQPTPTETALRDTIDSLRTS